MELWRLSQFNFVDNLLFVQPPAVPVYRLVLNGERKTVFERALRNQNESDLTTRLDDLIAGKQEEQST